METKTKLTVRDMAYIAMFAVIMAVCSWISVPYVVPFTLQTFGVFLAVGVLGGKRGTLAWQSVLQNISIFLISPIIQNF